MNTGDCPISTTSLTATRLVWAVVGFVLFPASFLLAHNAWSGDEYAGLAAAALIWIAGPLALYLLARVRSARATEQGLVVGRDLILWSDVHRLRTFEAGANAFFQIDSARGRHLSLWSPPVGRGLDAVRSLWSRSAGAVEVKRVRFGRVVVPGNGSL